MRFSLQDTLNKAVSGLGSVIGRERVHLHRLFSCKHRLLTFHALEAGALVARHKVRQDLLLQCLVLFIQVRFFELLQNRITGAIGAETVIAAAPLQLGHPPVCFLFIDGDYGQSVASREWL